MSNCLPSGVIHITNLRLWSHVGELEHERLVGQWFSLDIDIWLDLDRAAREDDLSATADYSVAIRELQQLSFRLNCFTIEYFSEQILSCLESLYGHLPMRVTLRKCSAPVPGFTGTVAVERCRNWKETFG